MQILRLLATRRRAVSTITTAASCEEDEGPFFDLDFSSPSSARAASCAASGSESCADLDFVISLQRSRSASPSYEALLFGGAAPVKLCASLDSEPMPARAMNLRASQRFGLRSLSFGAKKSASFGGRNSFARRSCSSARSLRLLMASSDAGEEEEEAEQRRPATSSGGEHFTKISTRFRAVAGRTPRATAGVEARGLRGLRKCRSASAATVAAASRLDDSVLEKLDGIASAIAHCKESLHRASSVSERDGSPLLRSKSDPGKWEASQASH